jgi:Uma2 family endonuclease
MSAQTETWPRPHRLTVDDYYRMAEAGVLSPDDRTELIEGEIIDMAPIGTAHADMVRVLNRRLVELAGDRAQVSVQLPIRLSRRSEPQPDLAVLRGSRERYRHAHPSASDTVLLIEVSDTTLRYDLENRARLYATHGIREYWVVDVVNNRIWRHRAPTGTRFADIKEVTRGPLELPDGLGTIEVNELF